MLPLPNISPVDPNPVADLRDRHFVVALLQNASENFEAFIVFASSRSMTRRASCVKFVQFCDLASHLTFS